MTISAVAYRSLRGGTCLRCGAIRSAVVCSFSIRYFVFSKSPRFNLRDQMKKQTCTGTRPMPMHKILFALMVTSWTRKPSHRVALKLSVGVTRTRLPLISSKSRVCLLEDRDPVGRSASRSAGLSQRTVLIGRTSFDSRASIPDPALKFNSVFKGPVRFI